MIPSHFTSFFNHASFRTVWVPFILFTFALILRIWQIDAHQIQLDEPFTIYHSQASLIDIFKMLPNENNPPLYFLILHFWIELFGTDPFFLRLLSAIFSSLAVVYTYLLGRDFLHFRIGLFAALLLCLSNLNIFFAHEVRVYSLFTLLGISTTYYFFNLHYGRGKKGSFRFILSSLLLIYSHFFGFILLGALFLLPFCSKQLFYCNLKKRLMAFLWIALLYSPYILILVNRFLETSGDNWVPQPNMSHLSWGIELYTNLGIYAYMVKFLLVIYIFFFLWVDGFTYKKGNLIVLLFSFCFFGMFFASTYLSMFIERYIIYLSPFFYLSLVYILFYITKFNRLLQTTAGLLLVLAIGSKTKLLQTHSREPLEVADFIRQFQSPNSIAIIIPKWWELNIAYYYDIEIFNDYGNLENRLEEMRIYSMYKGNTLDKFDHEELKQVLYIDFNSNLSDPDSTAYSWCRNRFYKDSLVGRLDEYHLTLFYEPK